MEKRERQREMRWKVWEGPHTLCMALSGDSFLGWISQQTVVTWPMLRCVGGTIFGAGLVWLALGLYE